MVNPASASASKAFASSTPEVPEDSALLKSAHAPACIPCLSLVARGIGWLSRGKQVLGYRTVDKHAFSAYSYKL